DIQDPAADTLLRLSRCPTVLPPSPSTAPHTIRPRSPAPLPSPADKPRVGLSASPIPHSSPARPHRPARCRPAYASSAARRAHERTSLSDSLLRSRSTPPPSDDAPPPTLRR